MNNNTNQTGVYSIRNIMSDKRYLGSAALSFRERWSKHRSGLRRGVHHNRHLQAAWNKYGEHSFVFEIEELCNPIHVINVEQALIEFYKAHDGRYGYNINPTAWSPLGLKRSAATRAKIAATKRGKKRSPEVCERMRGRKPSEKCIAAVRAASTGRIATADTRAKMSQAQRGRTHSDATRAKMSVSMTGLKRSAAFCAQLSARHKGKQISPETRAKISAAGKGRKCSDATRALMSAAQHRRPLGFIKHSAESRAKMSAAHKGVPKSAAHIEAIRVARLRAKYERAAAMFAFRGFDLPSKEQLALF